MGNRTGPGTGTGKVVRRGGTAWHRGFVTTSAAPTYAQIEVPRLPHACLSECANGAHYLQSRRNERRVSPQMYRRVRVSDRSDVKAGKKRRAADAAKRRSREWRSDAVAALGCAVVVWLLFVRGVGPADLSVFLHAGRSVARGASPYSPVGSAQLWSGHAFVYPYVTAWLFVPLSALSPATAGLVYYALSIAALVVATRMVVGHRFGVVPVIVGITAEPVVRSLQLGTLNAWLLLGLATAWRYRDRAVPLTAALGMAITAKLFLLPMVAWLVLTRRYRAAAATALIFVGAIVVGCALADLSLGAFLRMLSILSAHEQPHSSSLAAALGSVGVRGAAIVATPALAASLAVAAGWVAYRRTGQEALLFAACVLASIIASPIVWSHYFTLLLVIPLTMSWRPASQLITLAATWLSGMPDRAGILSAIHPFPGAGWLWAAIVAVLAMSARRRSQRASSPETRRRLASLPEWLITRLRQALTSSHGVSLEENASGS